MEGVFEISIAQEMRGGMVEKVDRYKVVRVTHRLTTIKPRKSFNQNEASIREKAQINAGGGETASLGSTWVYAGDILRKHHRIQATTYALQNMPQ